MDKYQSVNASGERAQDDKAQAEAHQHQHQHQHQDTHDEYDAFDSLDESELERRAIEDRKKRRDALMAKFDKGTQNTESTQSIQSTQQAQHTHPATPFTENLKGIVADPHEGISAADYNYTLDRREDVDSGGVADGATDTATATATATTTSPNPPSSDASDDDMFALQPSKKQKRSHTTTNTSKPSLPIDGSTDSEGYYMHTFGERLDNNRYIVFASLGVGMFSKVVRVKDTHAHDKEYAVKIIRSQESMKKAALKEVNLLERLKELDAEDRKHVVRIERTFEHRGHLCIVFESLGMNLREILKRFGANVGINIKALRAYAHQILLALSLLKKANVMHADMKPDNILVSENKALLKVCDLGSAADVSEGDITPYLVSRFYRAPEIILGLPYDTAIDMWSVGCTLYEMYTGQILFSGRSNNEMLKKMMELKGKFNHKMIKKGVYGTRKVDNNAHFTEHFDFISNEVDKMTNQASQMVAKTLPFSRPTKDLRDKIIPSIAEQKGMKEDEIKSLHAFADLLDKMLSLDPQKRISVRDALGHPFFTA
ncbi:hypothetical protein E3P77_00081 [Wallemia ichthyophaga]|nr:hypothetical protein E3P77_00081 [Wallemia ichthyophaga]